MMVKLPRVSISAPGASQVAVALVALSLFLPSSATATQLRSSFGEGGIAFGSNGSFKAASVQPSALGDGRIVAAGVDEEGRMLLQRFLGDGSVDPTFGDAGRVIGQEGSASDLAVDDAGRIFVVSGTRVLAFDRDGSPDASFGEGGETIVNEGRATLESIGLDDAGHVVVAGDARPPAPASRSKRRGKRRTLPCPGYGVLLTARLEPSGELDPSWGDGGVAIASAQDRMFLEHRDLEVTPGGRVVTLIDYTAGCPLGAPSTRLVDYGTTGTPDFSHYGGSHRAGDLVQDDSGRFLVPGRTIYFPAPPVAFERIEFPEPPLDVDELLAEGAPLDLTCGALRCEVDPYLLVDAEDAESIGLGTIGHVGNDRRSLAPRESHSSRIPLELPELVPKMREAGVNSIEIHTVVLLCPPGYCNSPARFVDTNTYELDPPVRAHVLSWSRPASIEKLRTEGVTATTSCSQDCVANLRLTVSRTTRRKFELPSRTIGETSAPIGRDAPQLLRATLSPPTRRALSNHVSERIRYRATVTATRAGPG